MKNSSLFSINLVNTLQPRISWLANKKSPIILNAFCLNQFGCSYHTPLHTPENLATSFVTKVAFLAFHFQHKVISILNARHF